MDHAHMKFPGFLESKDQEEMTKTFYKQRQMYVISILKPFITLKD